VGAIELSGVVKSFGPIRAVDGLDLDVPEGICLGLLGPNGAGKSTTMRLLTGQAIADAGQLRVLGHELPRQSKEARALMGVVPQLDNLDIDVTVEDNLAVYARLYRVRDVGAAVDRALDLARLRDRRRDAVEKLSGGMRRRLLLARGLVHEPRLVLLDEPTVGLDPQASRDLRDRVRELKAQGRTVLLTTHYMEEADQLCDRVAIIDHGRIVALDTPAALKRTIRAEEVVRLEIAVEGDERPVIDRLARSATVARSERSNGTLAVTAHCASARDFVPAAFDAARSTGATIRHVEVVPVTLEDVFLALTGRALRE
jgi:ABC-type multidrug transport system ATPase subunit